MLPEIACCSPWRLVVAAAVETETALTSEAAAAGWQRHRQWQWRKHQDNNDAINWQLRLQCGPGIALLLTMAIGKMTTITMMMTAAVMMTTIMTTTFGRGASVAVLETEPAAAAEVVTVAMARADINQQRAAKMVVAAIAVGKRHQARGEKRRRWQGRQ